MNFRFISVIHNLELESIKNKGIAIFQGARISNGQSVKDETLNTPLFRHTLGTHSIDEFNNSTYVYIDGNFANCNEDDFNKIGLNFNFYLLRQVQAFLHNLWEVKDHSIYIRDGFLVAYNHQIQDGLTFKASLSEIFSKSDTTMEKCLFSDLEIKEAKDLFIDPLVHTYNYEQLMDLEESKTPTADHFLKSENYPRTLRAEYFTNAARKSAISPMKIVFYCNALECLFTSDKTEISHKISERVALMLGSDSTSKENYFKIVKEAYNVRSSLVHGQQIKGNIPALNDLSVKIDEILRQLLRVNHEVFSMKNNEADKFFRDLLFS